jgi:hypothetical protein
MMNFLEPISLIPSERDFLDFYTYIEKHSKIFETCPFILIKGERHADPINFSSSITYTEYVSEEMKDFSGCFLIDIQSDRGTSMEFKISATDDLKLPEDQVTQQVVETHSLFS